MVRLGLPVRLDRQMAAAAARRPRQVAGEAGHFIVAVRAVLLCDARPPFILAVFRTAARHQLGARRLGVEMRPRRHRLLDEADPPFELRIDDRPLDQADDFGIVIILEFEAPTPAVSRSEENTSELQSLMRTSYAV